MTRVTVFLIIYFVAIAGPVAMFAYLAASGPDPYVIVGEGPGPEWEEERLFDDGTHISVARHDTPEAATEAARALVDAVPTAFINRTFDVARYRRSDDERHGLILPVEQYVIGIEAPSAEFVEEHFAALDFVAENPERNIVWIAMTERSGLGLTLIGLYVVFLVLLLARGGAWAGQRPPLVGVQPASAPSLRDTLLAINELNHPFHVFEERPGRLVAEWRLADPDWAATMASSGLRRAYRIHLELDEASHTVRSLEKTYKIAWGGGIRSLSGRVSFFQGIAFNALDGGGRLGVSFEPGRGPVADDRYTYRFDPSEMRKPLAETITGMGWTWRPVMTLFRPVGG
jgi:hypothetical protein